MSGTDQRLIDVLEGREENYLLPFYWQHGNHTERIPEQIGRIASTGCRALCVESRPHPDFGGDGWWRDMDVILDECTKRGMKVWILDDKHFPTGYANGYIKSRHPELRQWVLIERHVDVMGPMKDASLLMNPDSEQEPLVGVWAFRRSGDDEKLCGQPVDLNGSVRGGYVYWDIPEGLWRVFFVYRSRRGSHDGYIDMVNPASAAVQIEAVYEPHYQHYARYFGNTLAGFFSDEPEFGNSFFGPHRVDKGFYEMRIGQDGLALPYNDDVLAMMSEELGENASPYLGELWYESPHSPLTRLAYMNAVTRRYRDGFCRPVGDWCRAHGVQYIGHVIEDMNIHARLGHGAGHYFRALDGQDMSGIDIVLHQVMPGRAHDFSTASCSSGVIDGNFFHYVLGQLAASLAHQNPRMAGKAMCEVFGAYGWAEGTPFMKWLMDFLLVRGVNHFVPHAFSPDYPDPDCPPHFGAEGHDPQLDGFTTVMRVANQTAHLLSGGTHVADAAVLYHAEGEWMSPYDTAMLTQVPARALLDAQINYDIVCADVLSEQASVKDGRLCIGDETFGVMVVPYAPRLPRTLLDRLAALSDSGLPVLWVGGRPEGAAGGSVVTPDALAAEVRSLITTDLSVDGDCPLLRVYHTVREGNHIFMLFNETATPVACTLHLPVAGRYARLRLYDAEGWCETTEDGAVAVSLLAGQSELLVFGDTDALPDAPAGLPGFRREHKPLSSAVTLHPTYDVSLADTDSLHLPDEAPTFVPYRTTDTLFNVTGPDALPDFSGLMRYEFTLTLDHVPAGAVLDLGRVGQNVRLFINGQDAGIRVAEPYAFPAEALLHEGENRIVAVAANTLVGRQRDHFSFYMQLPPSGLLGDLILRGE